MPTLHNGKFAPERNKNLIQTWLKGEKFDREADALSRISKRMVKALYMSFNNFWIFFQNNKCVICFRKQNEYMFWFIKIDTKFTLNWKLNKKIL